MKNSYKQLWILIGCTLPLLSFAASPWLPAPGQLNLSLGLSDQFYDSLWQGPNITPLPATINMNFGYVGYTYGISESFATDLLTGYASTTNPAGTRGDLGGIIDTSVGLLYRPLDEFKAKNKYVPTITFRLGGTLKGNYRLANNTTLEPNNLQAPGDRVDGSQISIILGKNLPLNFAVFGEFGYRYRGSVVPNAYFGNIGVLQTFVPNWTWSLSYEYYYALFGIDIGKPPFTGQIGKFGFQATEERTGYVNGSITYTLKTGQSVSVIYGQAVNGRNSAVSKIVSLFVTLPIDTKELIKMVTK